MTEENATNWELFIKQKNGTAKPEELSALNQRKEKYPGEFESFETVYQATQTDTAMPAFDPVDNWNEIRGLIRANDESAAAKTVRMFPGIARIAAGVIAVLGFAYIFNVYTYTGKETLVLQTMVQTESSEMKEVLLPDGSVVWLNRNSELLFPEQFNGADRTVYLKGEAFFEVTPNKDKPFIIFSGSSKTTVLGTSFNLRAYGKEDEVKLTVVTGKVAFTLNDDKERVIVTPGNMAVMTNEDKHIVTGVNTDINFLSWKTKRLAFDENRLDDMIFQLERHFDVEIVIENEDTKQCTFTGDFNHTELENTLKIITKATGTSFDLDRGQYIIRGKGCN